MNDNLIGLTHIRHSDKRCRLHNALVLLISVIGLCLLVPIAVSAITPITQGFLTTDNLSLGSIVSLQNNSSDHVVAANISNTSSILGVVTNGGNSFLSLSNGSNDQVQIATSGMTSVLVSDINGAIIQGDQITASPIEGVGMKATDNTKVVGIAQGTPVKSASSQQYYTDSQGKKQSIILGEVPLLVNVAYYFKTPEKTIIPKALQDIANTIAGRTVDTLPILISGAIFIITLIVVVIMIYSMISSSIISVGRNPMSQSAVYRNVIQISCLILAILLVALISIYIILTRL